MKVAQAAGAQSLSMMGRVILGQVRAKAGGATLGPTMPGCKAAM